MVEAEDEPQVVGSGAEQGDPQQRRTARVENPARRSAGQVLPPACAAVAAEVDRRDRELDVLVHDLHRRADLLPVERRAERVVVRGEVLPGRGEGRPVQRCRLNGMVICST